jgi:hypothetical protein
VAAVGKTSTKVKFLIYVKVTNPGICDLCVCLRKFLPKQ